MAQTEDLVEALQVRCHGSLTHGAQQPGKEGKGQVPSRVLQIGFQPWVQGLNGVGVFVLKSSGCTCLGCWGLETSPIVSGQVVFEVLVASRSGAFGSLKPGTVRAAASSGL